MANHRNGASLGCGIKKRSVAEADAVNGGVMYKICYWTLEGRGAGNERYTWRISSDQERIRCELEHSEGCAVRIAWISKENPEQEQVMSNIGTLDYGSGRYTIVGGSDDGHVFHAGEVLEVYYGGQWVPAIIELDANGCWYFLSPLDGPALPADLYELPVRLAHHWGRW